MPPNRFESEVESFLEGSHGDRTHIKRADHPRLHHYAGRYFAFRGAQWCCRFQSPHGRGPVREKVRPAWSDGGREREIVRPAHEKWPKIAVLWRAGRDYSRKRRWKGCVGRVFSRSSNRGIPRDELCCAVALVVGPSTGSVNPSMRCYTLLVAWWAACPRNHLSG